MKRTTLLYIATAVVAALLATYVNDALGFAVFLVLFLLVRAYECRWRPTPQIRERLAWRLAPRIQEALEQTLTTPRFTIHSLNEWPPAKLLELEDTPTHPAPIRAWDVVVQVDSCESETLTIMADVTLLVIPAIKE